MPKLKFLISGGGTGGHIFPAVAVAQEIQNRIPEAEILFIGAEGKMEMEKVPKAGFKIIGLPIRGLQRKLSLKNLILPFKILASIRKVSSIVKTFQPDAAIGFGGYAAGPALWVASRKGVPTFLQEQNAFAGITNKLLAKKAKAIFTAYPEVQEFFPPNKCIITGNPVRSVFTSPIDLSKQEALSSFGIQNSSPTILITGGSLGARVLNQCALELIEHTSFNIIWQCGASYYTNHKNQVDQINCNRIYANPFIEKMELAYSSADIVIARAGALTVSELACMQIPTVFIPSPYVAEDHQTKNAQSVAKVGAAILLQEQSAKEMIVEKVSEILGKPEELNQMKHAWSSLKQEHATQNIVNHILNHIND